MVSGIEILLYLILLCYSIDIRVETSGSHLINTFIQVRPSKASFLETLRLWCYTSYVCTSTITLINIQRISGVGALM